MSFDRSFTADLKVLCLAHAVNLRNMRPVEQLVFSQCTIFLEMDSVHKGEDSFIDAVETQDERNDLG
jgi:hypothetical protein